MRYFKRPWNESRGDAYDSWGKSLWYLEVDDELYVTRQLLVYENGVSLKYDEEHLEDEYGGLVEPPIDPENEGFVPFEISAAEFDAAWKKAHALNLK